MIIYSPLAQNDGFPKDLESPTNFFIGEKIKPMHNFPSPKTNKNEDSQAKTQFQLPLGGKHGLFLASTLDKLWKIIQLKIDDILLHQKDMIRDEIRLKMTEVMLDKQDYESQIANLGRKLKSMHNKHIKELNEMKIKVERAYKDKELVQKTLQEVQGDYFRLINPRSRVETFEDTIDNYNQMVDYLDTMEKQQETQLNAVQSLIGMYDIATLKRSTKHIKVDKDIQTEKDRKQLEAEMMKIPY